MFKTALCVIVSAVSLQAQAPVTYDRLVHARDEPQNWLSYWGDYSAVRYRTLDQINPSNVKSLRMEWLFQTGMPGDNETVPLVVNGVMYFTGTAGSAFALDARTGRRLWQYKYELAPNIKLCCGTANRGLALLGDKVFLVTPDAHAIALDIRTGQPVWDIVIESNTKGYGATMAPLVVKDKLIVGVSGGEFGIRGFIDAYNVKDGSHAWRFWTIPGKGEFGGDTWNAEAATRGGGPTWMTGTFDPELNTLYWGVGNPGPDLYGKERPGDNLFTCSLVALDPDTGLRKWHFQFTPHDTHDWDANETPMLLDLPWHGETRKLVLQANRNGFFYLLDRTNGKFLMAKQLGEQTWAREIDDSGRPVVLPHTEPSEEGARVCPGLAGLTNWMAPSYSPKTGFFYVQIRGGCDVYYASPPSYIAGQPFWGSMSRGVTGEKDWGFLRAMDPLSGDTKWEFRHFRAPWAGTLATSGGLVFAGDEDGYLMAVDAVNGSLLWKFNTGNRLVTAPITWMLDGRQYITMPSGGSIETFALPTQNTAK